MLGFNYITIYFNSLTYLIIKYTNNSTTLILNIMFFFNTFGFKYTIDLIFLQTNILKHLLP